MQLLVLLASSWLYTAQAAEPTPPVAVYVVANGWHAGLLVPAQAINDLLPTLKERFPKASHYEIGWGDVGFYRAKEITAGLAFEALFASKGSVMHVVGVADVAQFLKGSDIAPVCLPQASYQNMARQITAAFERTPDNKPVSAGPGIYGDSQFYQAQGSYSMLNTCNRWTASVLGAGSIDISPRLSLTAGSVLRAARGSALACTTAPASPVQLPASR